MDLDPVTKLVISWLVSPIPEPDFAIEFLADLSRRLANRVQLTTDRLPSYFDTVKEAFAGYVDYIQMVMALGRNRATMLQSMHQSRYTPEVLESSRNIIVMGNQDGQFVSTSMVERRNLTTRMASKRFTRLTNAFSKNYEGNRDALWIYFVWFNFYRDHGSLRQTSAQAAVLADRKYETARILDRFDRLGNRWCSGRGGNLPVKLDLQNSFPEADALRGRPLA